MGVRPASLILSLIKARWGRDGGLGGKDDGNAFFRFAAKRLGPPAPAETERRPEAVPVATKEATDIDSSARGSPSPKHAADVMPSLQQGGGHFLRQGEAAGLGLQQAAFQRL